MSPSRMLCLAAVAALVVPLLAACGSDGPAPAAGDTAGVTVTVPATAPATTTAPVTTTAPATTTAPVTITADVYFVRDERVARVRRAVAPPAVARAAMVQLLAGPAPDEQASGISTSIPPETGLRGLRVAGGVARVDLSGAFASGGGSSSMLSRVAQVVYTLTAFPTVRSVRFLIDGAAVDSIGGEGVITDHPLTRADFPDQAPPG